VQLTWARFTAGKGWRAVNADRLKLGLCAGLLLLAAAICLPAQQGTIGTTKPGAHVRDARVPNPHVPDSRVGQQQRRAARFLAQRGIGRAHSGWPASATGAADLLAAARAQHHTLAIRAQASLADASLTAPWQPVGPAQVTTAAYGAVTGRVSSLAVDPSDPSGNTLYVGTTGGGVWKSVNAAGSPASVSFTPLTDTLSAYAEANIASLSIGAVTVQPGGTGVVLAGTGDPNDATDSYYGAGILRSADGGATWSLISASSDALLGSSLNYSFTGNGFAGFAWSTVNPNLVVAGVSQAAEGLEVNAGSPVSIMGIYYSPDAGQTWYMATIADSPGQIVQSDKTPFTAPGNAATSVVWNPIRQMFYAAVRFHGYYQSADGINWMRMAYQPGTQMPSAYCPTNTGTNGSPACPVFRGALAVQPVTGDLFALTVDVNNLDQGLWQDVCALNGGACSSNTVTFASQIADAALEAGGGDTTIPQADYGLYLAAVPSSQDTLLFAGTEDIYQCSLANGCAWRNTTHATTCASAGVAWAQHAIDATFGAQGLLYFGNDGGLWRTTDDVDQQQAQCSPDDATHYQNLNPGLGSLAEVENLAEDATDPQKMMASLGALGTAAPQAASGSAWPQALDGEGNYAAIDPAAPANWYATSLFGVGINRCIEGSGCDIAGFGEPVIGSTQVGGDGDLQTIPAPWILDPQNTANLILGTCRVWRGAATGGAAWTSNSLLSSMLDGIPGPFCNGNAEIRSLAASGSPTDPAGTPERLYAGMAGLLDGGATVPGHVYTAAVTGSSGSSTVWTDLFHSPVSNGFAKSSEFNPGGFDISSIYVDPHDPSGQTVYVTVQGFAANGLVAPQIYGSTSGGSEWVNLTSNLTNAPANSIVVDPNDANTVYVATDTGVYITRKIASCAIPLQACWNVYGTSLPTAPVIQLAAFNEGSTSVLRAATYGRGIWQIGLVTAGTAMTTVNASPASLTFPGQALGTLSAIQTVVVQNTGTITLNTTQVSITGDFAETDDCTQEPVMPGDACTVEVTFTPSQTGPRTGTLTVYGNIAGGATGGQVTVALNGTGLAAPAIALLPTALTFTQTLLGQTSATQDIAIMNTGGVTAGLASETASGDFSIGANTCTASLSPNTECTVGIAFSPSASGNRSGTLTVVDSAGTQTAQLSGVGESPATDGLAPLSLTFAPQVIGTPSLAQQVTLTNNGDQTLQLIAIQVSGGFNAVNQCGTSLAGHSSCAIGVNFVPTQLGAESGTLIVSDAIRSQTVTLSGTGLAPPGISATPTTINFGNYAVGQTTSVQTVTLLNNGGVPLSGLAFAVTGDFATPSAANTCGRTLAVGAQCQIGATFTPSQPGVRNGALTITATELAKPLNVILTGNGQTGNSQNFTLAVEGSSSAILTSGQPATFQLSITPFGGLTGSVALTCTGFPQNANATCTVNPVSVTLPSGGSASASVTIVTGQASANAALRDSNGPGWGRRGLRGFGLTLCLLLPAGFLVRRRRGWKNLALVGLLALALPIGCNLGVTPGKETSGPTPPTNTYSTPSGTYKLTVTGTASGLSQTAYLTLTVE
jgi:hypothetical protein